MYYPPKYNKYGCVSYRLLVYLFGRQRQHDNNLKKNILILMRVYLFIYLTYIMFHFTRSSDPCSEYVGLFDHSVAVAATKSTVPF